MIFIHKNPFYGAKIRKLLHANNIFFKKCRLYATFYLKRLANEYHHAGTGTEVNPESWTQLKGSNETNF